MTEMSVQDQVRMLDAVVSDHQDMMMTLLALARTLVEVSLDQLDIMESLASVKDEEGREVFRVDLEGPREKIKNALLGAMLPLTDAGEGH